MNNLIGKTFGRLKVVGVARRAGAGKKILWTCICDCDGVSFVRSDKLRSGRTKSCGCLKVENRRRVCSVTNLLGQRFGRLVAIGLTPQRVTGTGGRVWLCKCDCGRYRTIASLSLRRHLTRSCGCIRTEIKESAGHKGARASHYPRATEEEYLLLQQTKKMWKGLEEYVRQQRNEREVKPSQTNATLSA